MAKPLATTANSLLNATGVNKTWQQVMNNQGVYDNMGLAFLKDNQTDSAQVYFRKAIQCLQHAAVADPSQEELRKSALGTVYGNLGQAYAAQTNTIRLSIYTRQTSPSTGSPALPTKMLSLHNNI